MSPLNVILPSGFRAEGLHCGIKKRNKDLALLYSKVPAVAAGVFTTNQVQAAPVKLTREVVCNGTIQAIIANSGNANCASGPQSERDAMEMARVTAQELEIDIAKVAVASTGSIGKPLPIRIVIEGIENLVKKINPQGLASAAQAIMTTDTAAKAISREITLGKHKITISAIAKGAGMIQPNMATMLCFIMTDLQISRPLFQQLIKESVNQSFNCITVDGCMSTNDMVLGMANGLADNPPLENTGKEFDLLQKEFNEITLALAKKIVRDGEGATKLVQIQVNGAHSRENARQVALSIANSTLLKCSFFGETLNFGRILAAVGTSGVPINPQNIDIAIGEIQVVTNSQPVRYPAAEISSILKQKKFSLSVNLHQGADRAIVWTCDLTPKYVKINME